jgi:hypothetical protein
MGGRTSSSRFDRAVSPVPSRRRTCARRAADQPTGKSAICRFAPVFPNFSRNIRCRSRDSRSLHVPRSAEGHERLLQGREIATVRPLLYDSVEPYSLLAASLSGRASA